MEQPETPFPVKTKKITTQISGLPTDFVINVFSNRVFIIISQNGKPGTLIQVSREASGVGNAGGTPRVLMGKRDAYLLVYAKKISELIGLKSNKPLLLALCVLNETPDVFRSVMQVISENCIW